MWLCSGDAVYLQVADPAVKATAEKQLNVLFIAVDDMNTELGVYGSRIALTPNIDRLAERGLLFRRAYAQQAVCNPSRASLMTGMRPDTLRVWDLRTHFRDTHPQAVTLPQLFKDHGYFTQGIGKIFHNWGAKPSIAMDPPSWSVPQTYNFAPHFSDWYVPGAPRGTPADGQGAPTQRADVPDETYFDGRIAQEAIQSLRQHKDEPFFLGVGFWKPHLPFNAPKKYWDLFDPDAIPAPLPAGPPTDVPKIALHDFRELRGYAGMPKEGPLTPAQVRHLRHGYYAAISYVDAQIGKVINELDRLGLSDRTIIVLWSDHGFHIGEHALWAKTSNFERDARVPLIISTPGQKTAGRQTNAVVELLDVYPTLADLANLPRPDALEGISLRPLLDNPDQVLHSAALTQFPRPPYFSQQPHAMERPDVMGYSIRTPRYRYTEWRDVDSRETVARELYDHDNDPIESINLADSPRFRNQVSDLAGLLERAVRSGAGARNADDGLAGPRSGRARVR
ncbi:MAG: sulfatase-like hydrolase/transferase [Luteitalea sp.]|nr:sulfatase-like hydrolase/transferase [Luteitalea sp.]